MRFDFQVSGTEDNEEGNSDGRDIVLVAELKADAGEVDFDLDSLTLIRL